MFSTAYFVFQKAPGSCRVCQWAGLGSQWCGAGAEDRAEYVPPGTARGLVGLLNINIMACGVRQLDAMLAKHS